MQPHLGSRQKPSCWKFHKLPPSPQDMFQLVAERRYFVLRHVLSESSEFNGNGSDGKPVRLLSRRRSNPIQDVDEVLTSEDYYSQNMVQQPQLHSKSTPPSAANGSTPVTNATVRPSLSTNVPSLTPRIAKAPQTSPATVSQPPLPPPSPSLSAAPAVLQQAPTQGSETLRGLLQRRPPASVPRAAAVAPSDSRKRKLEEEDAMFEVQGHDANTPSKHKIQQRKTSLFQFKSGAVLQSSISGVQSNGSSGNKGKENRKQPTAEDQSNLNRLIEGLEALTSKIAEVFEVPVHSESDWMDFQRFLSASCKIVMGVLFEDGSSSFRTPRKKKPSKTEGSVYRLEERFPPSLGVALKCEDSSTQTRLFFLPLSKRSFNGSGGLPSSREPHKHFADINSVLSILRDLLKDDTCIKMCFHLQRFLRVLLLHTINNNSVSIDCVNLVDPLIACWLLSPDSNEKQLSIDSLISRYMGIERPEDELEAESPSLARSSRIDSEQTLKISPVEQFKQDLLLSEDLLNRIRNSLDEQGLADSLLNQEMPLVSILATLDTRGIAIAKDRLLQNLDKVKDRIESLSNEAHSMVGRQFLLTSPEQVAHVLFEELGLASVGPKGKKHFSTSDDVLKQLEKKHPIIALIQEHRYLTKLQFTYLDSLSNHAVIDSPRTIPTGYKIYTQWNQCSTGTGRLSSSDPNLQNLPSNSHMIRSVNQHDTVINVRDAFIPSSKNSVLVAVDYSQIEMRVLAHYCRDETLCRVFSTNQGDVYKSLASHYLGKAIQEVTQEERQQAKAVVLAIVYGSGNAQLGKMMDVSQNDARTFHRDFLNKFPGISRFLVDTKAAARKNGFVTTLSGRRRFLPDIHSTDETKRSEAERQAVNTIIQGTASDIMKLAMISVEKRLRSLTENGMSCQLLLQIHDELLFECADKDLDALVHCVSQSMENIVSLSVPLRVKVECGRTWGSMVEYTTELKFTPAVSMKAVVEPNLNKPTTTVPTTGVTTIRTTASTIAVASSQIQDSQTAITAAVASKGSFLRRSGLPSMSRSQLFSQRTSVPSSSSTSTSRPEPMEIDAADCFDV